MDEDMNQGVNIDRSIVRGEASMNWTTVVKTAPRSAVSYAQRAPTQVRKSIMADAQAIIASPGFENRDDELPSPEPIGNAEQHAPPTPQRPPVESQE